MISTERRIVMAINGKVYQLSERQIEELQSFKGVPNGRMKYFDRLSEIYEGDEEILKDINDCKEILESLPWIESYPAAQKSLKMYYEYVDALNKKIGYHS